MTATTSGMLAASDVNYLLFVVPGFLLIWSFRYFSGSEEKMDGFEYAVWSFVWGMLYIFALYYMGKWTDHSLPGVPLDNVGAVDGAALGLSPYALGTGALVGLCWTQLGFRKYLNRLSRWLRKAH